MMRFEIKSEPIPTMAEAVQFARDYWDNKDGKVEEPQASVILFVSADAPPGSMQPLPDDKLTLIVRVGDIIYPNWYVMTRGGWPT